MISIIYSVNFLFSFFFILFLVAPAAVAYLCINTFKFIVADPFVADFCMRSATFNLCARRRRHRRRRRHPDSQSY